MFTVEVRHRVVGAPPTLEPELSSVVLELLNEQITAAELIRRTVEEQVRDLLMNRKLDAEQARRALNRQYLTQDEVQQQAASGAVRVPKMHKMPDIDPATEADKAVQAFANKTYLIVVDGVQVQELDETLTLKPTSKVTFMRLTPLVGG